MAKLLINNTNIVYKLGAVDLNTENSIAGAKEIIGRFESEYELGESRSSWVDCPSDITSETNLFLYCYVDGQVKKKLKVAIAIPENPLPPNKTRENYTDEQYQDLIDNLGFDPFPDNPTSY